MLPAQRSRVRQAVSLSDLFFNLVIVTAFTRVGIAITNSGDVTGESILYFAVFWTIWSKEASYSTRFDTTDLSSKLITLLNCFAVLFASLSVSSDIRTEGANRIMAMSAFCSMLHFFLMARVFSFYRMAEPNTVDHHVQIYALFNSLMNLVESATWISGMFFIPLQYRYIVFTVGVLMGLRIPRAFLANDFHGTFEYETTRHPDCADATTHIYQCLLSCSCQFETRRAFHSFAWVHAPKYRRGRNRFLSV
jgi:low temperature requirement protein LtrA